MILIESRQNGTLKHLARLAREKKYRLACGEMLCEGEKMLIEALESGAKIKMVLVHASADSLARGLAFRAEQAGAQLFQASDAIFRLASDVETPQSVIFTCAPMIFETQALESATRVLILDALQDPGNIGTILRTAEAFALDAVVLAEGCADATSPKVVRATMGAIFRLPIVRMALSEAIQTLRRNGLPIYAAALTENAIPVREAALLRSAVIIGNEGHGVSPQALALADKAVILPMRGRAESLNAGVAAAILMWEMSKGG